MPGTWYWTRDGKTHLGPYTDDQLREHSASGRVLPTDMVVQEGSTKWVRVSSVEGLASCNAAPAVPQRLGEQTPKSASPLWPRLLFRPVTLSWAVAGVSVLTLVLVLLCGGSSKNSSVAADGKTAPPANDDQDALQAELAQLKSDMVKARADLAEAKTATDREIRDLKAELTRAKNGQRQADKPPPEAHPADAPGAPVETLSAGELFAAFNRNGLEADEKYAGKRVAVTGISYVSKGDDGRYRIGFVVFSLVDLQIFNLSQATPQQRQWFLDGKMPPNVVGHIAENARQQFAQMGPGGTCTVIGVCKGTKKDPTVHMGVVVELEDCVLKDGK